MCAHKVNGRPLILCPSPAPKRLLTSSNWICRNDSSNVNAILHPATYLSPRLKYGEKTKGDVIEKHVLSRNNCYCQCKNKNVPKPTFLKRPNTCVSYGEATKTEGYEDDLKRDSLTGCVCFKDPGADSCGPLRSREQLSLPNKIGLQYTDQRRRYADFRRAQQEQYEEKIQSYTNYDGCEQCCKYDDEEDVVGSDIDTILGTQVYESGTSSNKGKNESKSTTSQKDDFNDFPFEEFPQYSCQSITAFRNEHYFETHDIGKKVDPEYGPKDHACVHQFKLDKRWLPEPVKKDVFGRSLCKTCDRPMGGSCLNLNSGYLFSEDGVSRAKLKNYADSYKCGLIPKTINLSRGKTKIELVLNDSDLTELGGVIRKTKQPVYCNSLALRHQKMRLI